MDNRFSLTIIADLNNLTDIYHFVEQTTASLGLGESTCHDIKLVVDEAATNIIIHGCQDQNESIEIEIRQEADTLVVQLRDNSPLFNPLSIPPPDLTKPLAERSIGGMGIHLIRQLMDEVNYRVTSSGDNELTLIKRGIGKK